jgi:hypothetical protein
MPLLVDQEKLYALSSERMVMVRLAFERVAALRVLP